MTRQSPPVIPDELWSREIATSSTSGGLLATSRLQEPVGCHGRERGLVDTLRLVHPTWLSENQKPEAGN